MNHSGSIKIHSKEEAEALLKLYKPLLTEAEEKYYHLKNTVHTLESVLNGDDGDSTTSSKITIRSYEWNPESWADRVFLALDIIGKECMSRDIVKIVTEEEPHIHKTTVEKSLSSALWTLEKADKIIRRKDDNNRKLISLPEWTQKNNQ